MAIDVEQIIRDSLFSLLETKPLRYITIKDILQESGVARQTFYNHFHSIDDLICWVFSSESEKFVRDYWLSENWVEYLTRILEMFRSNSLFYSQAAASDHLTAFPRYLYEYTKRDYTAAFTAKFGRDILTNDILFAIRFNAYGASNMGLEYIRSGMQEEPRVYAERIMQNMPSILKENYPEK